MDRELDAESTPSSASLHDIDALRSAASSTPPTSLTSGPSDLADAPKAEDHHDEPHDEPGQQSPPEPLSEPRRSSRARNSVGTYNLATLVGTNVHTPTKYLIKNGQRTMSGDTLVDGLEGSKMKLLEEALDKDWTLDALPGDSLRRTMSAPNSATKRKGAARKSSRLNLVTNATNNAVQAASTSLSKRAKNALESGKNAFKSMTGDKGQLSRVKTLKEKGDDKSNVSATKRRRTMSMPEMTAMPATPQPQQPSATQKKRKLYLKQGLYVGQERVRPTEVKGRRRAAQKDSEAQKSQEIFPPLPMFFGERLIEEGRDFKLPYDVFCPLPRKVKKPEGWSNLKANRAIGDAIDIYKMMINEKEMSTCACTPEHPCTREENRCLNFVMGYECDEHNCAVGKTVCENRPFAELEERHDRGNEYDIGVEIMETKDKGYGIRSMRTFKPGQIILEYTGEIITQEECNRRMHKEYKNNKCYYLMNFDQKLIVDATQKGSIARFVNHSCEPNCQMIKMTVRGKPRMALFAGPDGIETGEELTYDYNFEAFSEGWSQQCLCGAPTCRGILGPKPKEVRVPKIKEALMSGAKSLKRKARDFLNEASEGKIKKRKVAKVARTALTKAKVSVQRSKSASTVASRTTIRATTKGQAGVRKSVATTTVTSRRGKNVNAASARATAASGKKATAGKTGVTKAYASNRAKASRSIDKITTEAKRSKSKPSTPASRAYARRRFMGNEASSEAAEEGALPSPTDSEVESPDPESITEQLEDQLLTEMAASPTRVKRPVSRRSTTSARSGGRVRKAPIKKVKTSTVRSVRGPRKGETLQRMGIQTLKGRKTVRVVPQ